MTWEVGKMKNCKIDIHPKKGRGVFAKEDIKKGEVIEICELILVPKIDDPILPGYIFNYNKKFIAVALGNGSLYNHASTPNASCYFDYKKKKLVFQAKRRIKSEEEIVINYGYSKEQRVSFNIVD
jgi:uncharacterized protein